MSSDPNNESAKLSPSSSREHRHSHRHERHHGEEKESGEGNEEGEEESGEKARKEKKKKKKSKKDRHERKDREKKRKRHGREYRDPDRPEDQDMMSFDKRSRSPPGPYDSPGYDSPSGPYDSPGHNRSPSKKRSSPGQYDRLYDSPPGLYDSPSYDEDSEDGSHNLIRPVPPPGYEGEYMETDSQNQGHGRKRKAGHISRTPRRSGENPGQVQPRKKPLLEIPRHERPHCKFYMEGKCAKGSGCPFNHDFRPPKKPEVCKFYLQSNCSKGDFCIYMHDDYPCKYFHTGADCYQGDNCKFSHEPLTDETRPLLDKILHGDEPDKPRPCLLGSPPRHLLEGGGDPTKKIPSLFDIQVFPPGQNPSPRKPTPASPSIRPSGFYQDANTPPQAPGPGPPPVNLPPPQQHASVPPVLNMIGAILRGAPPEVVVRAGAPGPNQGPPPGMQGPRIQGPGMGPGPRGLFMDLRGPRGPGGPPDMRGPGPNFHDNGPPGRGPMMDPRDPRAQGGPSFDPRDPRAQGMDLRGPHMDPRDPRSQGIDPRRPPGVDPRGPHHGMDPRGPPQGMDLRGPPPGMDPRGPQPGLDSRGMPIDSRDPRGNDPRGPRSQNMGPSGQADPRNQNKDPMEQRELGQRNQRPLLPDPRGPFDADGPPKDSWEARSQPQESRNVPFLARDPRAKAQTTRDPRSAASEQQDNQSISDPRSPPHESEVKVKEEPRMIAADPRRSRDPRVSIADPKTSPKHASDTISSPSAHRDGRSVKPEDIKDPESPISSKDSSKIAHTKTNETEKEECEPQDQAQSSEDTQETSEEQGAGENDGDKAIEMEIPSHLPPTQRNLFMRIRQHQQDNALSEQGETTETSDDPSAAKGSQDAEDDDWYSSDEDLEGGPKLMDVLKNLSKQPVAQPHSSPQAGSTPTASTFNIMQMIQSIKNQAPPIPDKAQSTPPGVSDSVKPRAAKRHDSTECMKGAASPKDIIRDYTTSVKPNKDCVNGSYPVIEAVLTSMAYRIKDFSVNGQKPYHSIPQNVDPNDPTYQNDPRVQKYISRVGKVKPPLSSPQNGEKDLSVPKPLNNDPRRARHLSIEEKASAPKPQDPRLRRADPRVHTSSEQSSQPPSQPPSLSSLQKAVSEQIAKALDPRGSDPRLQRVQSTPNPMSHSLPVRPVKDPRLGRLQEQSGPQSGGRQDPRNISRQHSHDGAVRHNDPRAAGSFQSNEPRIRPDVRMPFDQRMGPGPGPRPPFGNRMPFMPRMPFGPRMGPEPRLPFDPRMGPDQRMPFDPRMNADQRVHNEHPHLSDPRSGGDPRSGIAPLGDPRSGIGPPQGDPRSGIGPLQGDPRSGIGPPQGDPRSGIGPPQGDPNASIGPVGDPRSGLGSVVDPRTGVGPKHDPRLNAGNDPRLLGETRLSSDPRTQGLQRTNSDPRSANSESRLDPRQNQKMPSALLEPPKLTDPRNSNMETADTSESESGMSDSQSDQSAKRFDYRNDPRFKRKPASDTTEKGILVKKFTGQRKSSMEYSSPLGMEDSKSDDSSGYNSYNRQSSNQTKPPNKGGNWARTSSNSPGGTAAPSGPQARQSSTPPPDLPNQPGGPDLVTPGVADLMIPPHVPMPNEPPLKDLFKSIDPTASPFC